MSEENQTLESLSTTVESITNQSVAVSENMSFITLISDASLTVQLVMLILLLASLSSWTIIINKYKILKSEKNNADEFEDEFWKSVNLQRLFEEWKKTSSKSSGMSEIFVAGYREYLRSTERGVGQISELIDSVQRAMKVELNREIDELESQIPYLATVGSTSPYIGLFGTVWGIMNAFIALAGSTQQATIASVAPGIAEALIATAIGLFAAIPAVIAYNRYTYRVDKLVGRYEIFMDQFVSIVNRQTNLQQTNPQSANVQQSSVQIES